MLPRDRSNKTALVYSAYSPQRGAVSHSEQLTPDHLLTKIPQVRSTVPEQPGSVPGPVPAS